MNNNVSEKTSRLAKMALLAAISLVLVVATGWMAFPPAPFLRYDAAQIPILLATFAYGPLAGLSITAVVCFVQAFFMGGDGIVGFCMHLLATGTFVIVAGCLYRKHKTKKRAMLGLALGVLAMTVMMLLWNCIVTPFYLGVPREAVIAMLIPIFLPFNLLKAGINAFVTFLVYKPLSRFLHDGTGAKRKAGAVGAGAVARADETTSWAGAEVAGAVAGAAAAETTPTEATAETTSWAGETMPWARAGAGVVAAGAGAVAAGARADETTPASNSAEPSAEKEHEPIEY